MKKILQKYIPETWQKKWYRFKNPPLLDEVTFAYKLLKRSDTIKVMIDVGAHVGYSAEPFARLGWKIFAFEPDPHNRKKLEECCQKYNSVIIESMALSDKEVEKMSFYSSEVSTGISSLLNFHETHEEVTKVRVNTLKKYCTDHNIKEISFLKIDTEGYDLQVLKGYNWNLPHPRVIVTEFDNNKTQNLSYDFQDQADFLLAQGYEIIISEWYPLKEYGSGHKWRRFVTDPSIVTGEKVWGNIIAVKKQDWKRLVKIISKHNKIEQ